MKHLICPPCGTPISAGTEDELVTAVQSHGREHHDYVPSREEIMAAARDGAAPAQREAS